MRPLQGSATGATLPPLPRQPGTPIFGNQSLGTLPPIPGFNPASMPGANPMQGEHMFFRGVNQETGATQGPTLEDPGKISFPTRGNPLYYGQTSAYTGPNGPTDAPGKVISAPLKPVTQAQPSVTFKDALTFMYGDRLGQDPTRGAGGQQIEGINVLLGGPVSMTQGNVDAARKNMLGGLDLDAKYDPDNKDWTRVISNLGHLGQARSGGGDGGQ